VVHQAHILGDRVLRIGFTYGWSGWFGGWGGELGIKKVCRSGFITSFALATGNEAVGEVGLSMIGTVTCSDGSQIVCCDGGRRMGDQSASLTSSSGFQSIKVRSGPVVRGLCAQERCIGADGNEFEITCAHNRVLTGFQARAVKFWMPFGSCAQRNMTVAPSSNCLAQGCFHCLPSGAQPHSLYFHARTQLSIQCAWLMGNVGHV